MKESSGSFQSNTVLNHDENAQDVTSNKPDSLVKQNNKTDSNTEATTGSDEMITDNSQSASNNSMPTNLANQQLNSYDHTNKSENSMDTTCKDASSTSESMPGNNVGGTTEMVREEAYQSN